jgi:hypothetical protein
MLVDRSLRSMAVFTAICAVIMWIIVFSYLGPFVTRLNHNSTSVGRKHGESCGEAEGRNVVSYSQSLACGSVTDDMQASHLFINIVSLLSSLFLLDISWQSLKTVERFMQDS